MKAIVKSFTNRKGGDLPNQGGFSLVEELVSLGVVSLGLVLLIGMISTGAKGVTTTVDRVTGEGLARSQLEQVKADAYGAAYPTLTPPTGYAISLAVAYWDTGGGGYVASDTGSGLQRITVSVSHGGSPVLSLEDYKVDR
jgi:type II secretory pathway pseudopilin PulG